MKGNPDLLAHSRDNRKNQSTAEKILWQHLRSRQMKGFKFRRQHPIGTYIADFICVSANLIIELDGDSHTERREYDARRDDWLRSKGLLVFRCFNTDVIENMDGLMETVWKLCRERSSAPSP
jgi:very-short-patch-repair endonuclease